MLERSKSLALTTLAFSAWGLRTARSTLGAVLHREQTDGTPSDVETTGGKHDDALFRAVRATPGVTVAQAAEKVGVHPTGLYPVVRRLEAAGLIEKRGRELHLA